MASTASMSRSARYARWLAVPVGLVISAVLIWQASYAAFTDTTTNEDNTWTAGSVTITDNYAEAPMFSIEDLVPGDDDAEEITVTYSGTLDAEVSFYSEGFASTPAPEGERLADHIDLLVEGSAGSAFDERAKGTIFAGTLAEFAAMDSFDKGLKYPVGPEQPYKQGTFRFTYKVAEDAPQTVQGHTVDLSFVVEAQSTS
ncbi:TasA family protein [Georgenia sp. Marseille-Q6866]